MQKFEEITDGIYRLCIPFEDIYTSVFLIEANGGYLLFDAASSAADAEQYIIPAIAHMGAMPEQILISHSHDDHAGGLARLIFQFPDAKIGMLDLAYTERHSDWNWSKICNGDILLGCIKILHLPGHTADCIGLFDLRTNTLLSADCLQLHGIGRFGIGIQDLKNYMETLTKLSHMNINCIVAAHDYEPLGFLACGKENVKKYLAECQNAAAKLSV